MSVNDGLIEVVGLTGTVHSAQVLSGIGSPIILAQAKKIKLRFETPWPLQVRFSFCSYQVALIIDSSDDVQKVLISF